MALEWSTDRVMQMAPDAASAKAGQGLAQVRKWVSVGRDERVVWGECQGSGAKPYQVRFELEEAASKCSCPSRKFPCKHALGLMLIYASSPQSIGSQTVPPWVAEWIESRAERAKKKQEKAEAPPKPVDLEAQAERREKRIARIAEGLGALKTWSEDLVRGGIAALPGKGYAFFDEPARRMIDAQAPGVARRVQQLGEIAASGAGWQRPFMIEMASLALLIRAFEQLDTLPEASREDVLAEVGMPLKSDDPATFETVRDHWQIIAQEVTLEDRLRVQRTWLFGSESKRPAIVLAFAHGTAPLDSSLAGGNVFEGEVGFYPGNGTRVVVKSRGAVRRFEALAGFSTLDELCDRAGERMARQPWLGEVAAPLCGVVPVRVDSAWGLVDSEQRMLPAVMSDAAGWLAMAVSGGHSIDVAVAHDGRRLRALALVSGGEYISLLNSSSEGM